MTNGDILYVSRIMGDRDLWLYRPSDDSRQQLTKQVAELHENPTVAPDGKYVYFNSNRSGANHIWRMEPNGANPTQITFGEKQTEIFPQVSLDGEWLYYIQKSSPASTVWRRSLVDDRAEALTRPGELAPDSFLCVSPDGKYLAFHNALDRRGSEESKQEYPIAIIPTDKPGRTRFVNISASRLVVRWTPDGKGLEYIVNDSDGGGIWRKTLDDNQPPTHVVLVPKAFLHNFAWSSNGEKLVVSRGIQANDAILLTNFQP
jgi:Tol biopolymer transport system component